MIYGFLRVWKKSVKSEDEKMRRAIVINNLERITLLEEVSWR
jgi:hypothetical protein